MQNVLTLLMFAWIVLSYGCAAAQLKVVDWGNEPETYKRVQILTSKLVRVMDRINMHKYRYSVIENDMPQAYALCNSHTLLVYRGALNAFNDNQLMFILAHEISHIKSGHCQKRMQASKSEIRRQELDADLEAVKVIQRHYGIPATVYQDILAKLRKYTEDQGYGDDEAFDTHPAFTERIREVIQFYNTSIGTGNGQILTAAVDSEIDADNEGTAGLLALVVSPVNRDTSSLHQSDKKKR